MNVYNIKEFAKVGKSALIRLAGTIENFKIIETHDVVNFEGCNKDCPFYQERCNSPANFDSTYCDDYCRKHITTTLKSSYYNETNRYKLNGTSKWKTPIPPKTEIRLSKLQVKQFLLYHFKNVDRYGIIKSLSEQELADNLGCTLRTVRNNNKRLVDLGFISFSHAGFNNYINVRILGYQNYHLSLCPRNYLLHYLNLMMLIA